MRCAPSGARSLVQIRRPPHERAKRGTSVHGYLNLNAILTPEEAYKGVVAQGCDPELAVQLRSIDINQILAKMFGPQMRSWAEIPIALRPDAATARIIPSTEERDYSDCSESEIPGTYDRIWETKDAVYVIDYKTSSDKSASELLEAHHWQLTCGAIGALLAFEIDKPIFRAIVHVDDDMVLRKAENEASKDDLRESMRKLAHTIDRLRGFDGAQPIEAYSPSATACKYCPRHDECPATHGLLNQLVKAESGDALVKGLNRADAVRLVKRLKSLVMNLDDRMKESGRNSPIDMGDGKVYKEVRQTRSTIDATSDETRKILGKHEAADAIFYDMKCTSDAVMKAVGGDRARHRKIMAELKDAGAMKTTSYGVMKEVKVDAG
jgi:hypothetical protein